jgi:hypothetical protein
MATKRKAYRAPRNPAERIAEARAAISRLDDTLRIPSNRGGEYGRQCYEAKARWQAIIERELNH